MGFKVGLYSSAGQFSTATMGKGKDKGKEVKNPGSSGYEDLDANLFVNTFEIDYLAYGKGTFNAGEKVQSALNRYATMSYALTDAVTKNKNAKAVYFSVEDYMPDWINWAP